MRKATTYEHTTWRLFLHQADLAERIVLLPVELQRALGGLLEAACDMAQETYGIVGLGGSGAEREPRVQRSSDARGSVMTERDSVFHDELTENLPRRVDKIRTDVRKMLCFDDAFPDGHRGPYRRRNA